MIRRYFSSYYPTMVEHFDVTHWNVLRSRYQSTLAILRYEGTGNHVLNWQYSLQGGEIVFHL